MSRSYKKPIVCDRNPSGKRQANRQVRITKIESQPKKGNSYKKEYCSWNICDWRFYVPKPIPGGRNRWFNSHETEEEMRIARRKATRK